MLNPLPTQAGYDRWSACYDDYPNPLIALEEPEVRAALGDVDGLDVLDLACGTGRHSLRLDSQGARVVGLDFSLGMLAIAREAASQVRWIEHDLHERLPFASASFDRVVHALAIDHLEYPALILAEIARILRPSGRAVVSVMHPAMFLKGTQARFVEPESGELVVIENQRHTIADYLMACRASGLELLEIKERSCTAELGARFERARKYIDWPMLLMLVVAAPGSPRG